jgi:transcriptional regulator with XRE-family HTH domain
MSEQEDSVLLRKRMTDLRQRNHKTLSDLAKDLSTTKSTLSRVESGQISYKKIHDFAKDYCKIFGMDDTQTNQFMRATNVVVVDTCALLKNTNLIDDLSMEYGNVIVPRVVIDELDNIKNRNTNGQASKAWLLIKKIGTAETNGVIKVRKCERTSDDENNDCLIIDVARNAADEFHCKAEIITNDVGFSARLKMDEPNVKQLYIGDYMATRQNLSDFSTLKKIDNYYADSYDDIEDKQDIVIPNSEDINAFLEGGYTLIISAIRKKDKPISQRINKIRWLVAHGADINKRDNAIKNFPPLTHVIENNDYNHNNDLELLKFLLNECEADPNIGSRHPYDSGKIYQKNNGNMPLMVAAWWNKCDFVKVLCSDSRTSLNQQDANGFTALIKAKGNGFIECSDILIKAGADTKIVDRDGYTAEDRYNEYLETGIRLNKNYKSNNEKYGRNR